MIGTTLSHYQIVSELGRGGMGIVYKAEDTKLNRTVAIKVLPVAALGNEDDKARFFREAQAAAQLHHANIATVFAIEEAASDDGTKQPFIAMEYIDGETLTESIAKGPLKLDEAVEIATQVANALDAAHEKNIVHRDVKSGNVMLTKKGNAKVLDFGLAKTAQSTKLTQLGSTLGTIAYMSPEQARGEEVDRRSDLWSLGVLLYEMISGRLPYAGEYEQAAVYSILNEDPEPLTSIRTGVPMALELLVGKCLSKNADQRYQSATDLLVDLKALNVRSKQLSRASGASMRHSAVAAGPVVEVSSKHSALPIVAVGVLAFVFGALALYFLSPTETQPVRKFEYPASGVTALAISHGGNAYAYVQNDTLYARELSSLGIRTLTATSADIVFWSPDDSRIGYAETQRLFTIETSGGQPDVVSTFETGTIRGATWLASDDILVSVRSGNDLGEILSVRSSGGNTEVFRRRNLEANVYSFDAISSSIDGEQIVVMARDVEGVHSARILSDTGDITLFQERGQILQGLALSPAGYLVYSSLSTGIWSYAFSSDYRSVTGNAFRIAPRGAVQPSVSTNGIFAYVQTELVHNQVSFVSDAGETEIRFGQPSELLLGPAIHPEEDRVLISKNGNSLWLVDSRGSETLVDTGYEGVEIVNAWLSDGRRVILSSFREEVDIVVVDITGAKSPYPLVEGGAWAASLSRDESLLAFYSVTEEMRRDLFFVKLDVQPDTVAVVGGRNTYLSTPVDESVPQIHPDGDLLLYQTNASGRWQLVVRTFPDPDENFWPITIDGGYRARWHPNGRMIYYMTEDEMLWRVPFDRTADLPVGEPERLFSISTLLLDSYVIPYDIAPNSGRLVVVNQVREPADPSIVVVENWTAELER